MPTPDPASQRARVDRLRAEADQVAAKAADAERIGLSTAPRLRRRAVELAADADRLEARLDAEAKAAEAGRLRDLAARRAERRGLTDEGVHLLRRRADRLAAEAGPREVAPDWLDRAIEASDAEPTDTAGWYGTDEDDA